MAVPDQELFSIMATLPDDVAREVVDFAAFLAQRHTAEVARDRRGEDYEWSHYSLAQAMRGMEEDPGAEYTDADLRERW